MSRTTKWSGVAFMAVVGAACLIWRSWHPTPLSARQQLARDALTFPSEPTPGFEDRLSLSINGIDWMREVPTVESGATVSLKANWEMAGNVLDINQMIVAPRHDSDPDFRWQDSRSDRVVDVMNKVERFPVPLEPGNYLVRFYLRSFISDEQEELTAAVDLIAERRLIVTPSSSEGAESVRPGDDPKHRIPMTVARWGARDPRKE